MSTPADPSVVVLDVIDRVQAQLDAQLQADDSLDGKALGVLGANLATVGVLVAVHGSVTLWWLPIVVLGLGVVALLSVVWPVDTSTGPEWRTWYERFGGLSAYEARQQMLADLLEAVRLNSAATRNKGRSFKAGFILTFVGLGASVLVALVGN